MKIISRPKIIILGSLCRTPVAGIVLQALHYMLGFERLGFETYYVEWHGNWVEDPMNAPIELSPRRVIIGDVMKAYGFGDRWICQGDQVSPGYTFGGMSYEQLLKLYKEAEAIINVGGAHIMNEEQSWCPRRVYVESDPGIPQIKLHNSDEKLWNLVRGHTDHFTFGENIYGEDCLLPSGDLDYKTTRQPVVLDLWNTNDTTLTNGNFTTVARWRKPKEKTIEFNGEIYRWNKDKEFEEFLDLPKLSNQSFELALSEISSDEIKLLENYGWDVVDAIPLSSSLEQYLSYIINSLGEFTIAKDQYVRLRTGWFSDRSACYLAAGRPVITQDTGISPILPTGEGLFVFKTMDDVLAAIDSINGNYKKHSEAAYEIAKEYFDSDKVLKKILEQINLNT
jgi:hypothetical protein